jgi:hypothetical protein
MTDPRYSMSTYRGRNFHASDDQPRADDQLQPVHAQGCAHRGDEIIDLAKVNLFR